MIFERNKRGYFFTLDAFVAISILIIALVLFLNLNVAKGKGEQRIATVQDYASFMMNEKVSEYKEQSFLKTKSNSEYAFLFPNPDYSLLEEISYVYFYNSTHACADRCNYVLKEIFDSVRKGAIPPGFGVEVFLNDESNVIYSSSVRNKESARDFIVLRKAVLLNTPEGEIYGPALVGVGVWR